MKRFTLSLALAAMGCGLFLAPAASAQSRPLEKAEARPVAKGAAGRIEPTQLMAALSLIESGDNDKAVGKAGEVSRYQIMPHVWRAYGGGNPRNAVEAKRIATKIMAARIVKFAVKHGRQPSMVEVYALWRSPARAMRLRLSAAVRECGHRFSNLVGERVET